MNTEIVYKLTDEDMRTHGGYQWVLGEERTFPGKGQLCTSAYAHAYRSPALAVLMNPVHAYFSKPRLFRAPAVVERDSGTNLGCTWIRLDCEMELPQVTTVQRVEFAIRVASVVYSDPDWQRWAWRWLTGEDRRLAAARAAARTAIYANYAARAAAADTASRAAAYADADAADAASHAAALAAHAAACAGLAPAEINRIAEEVIGIRA